MSSFPFDPEHRRLLTERLNELVKQPQSTVDLKRAAVALVLLPTEGSEATDSPPETTVILTRRAPQLSRHGGQYALPGGRIDGNETPEEAALREVEEEIGLRLDPSSILGTLDDFVTRSGFHMTPVVVWGSPEEEIRPSPDEVAEVHRVPLVRIAKPSSRHLIEMDPGSPAVLSLAIVDTLVFAPTAAIMLQCARLAVENVVERVHFFEQPRFAWR